MSGINDHLVIAPVILPMAVAAMMLLIDERRRTLKAALGITTLAAVLAIALLGLGDSAAAALREGEAARIYRLGDWAAPYGIVLVADRLSMLMVALNSLLALCALVFSLARWDRAGPRFHALFLFLVMGVNGALLTGDLFNLFVFFEIMLAASYGLVLHGSGEARIRAGLSYIAVNLTASFLFLVGVALIYGVTGTLNMADLVRVLPGLAGDDRSLFHIGIAILGLAFLIKSAMWPVGLWLVPTYSAASAPAAAVFAILSKVGVYGVMRLSLLLTVPGAGAPAGLGQGLLVLGGLATIAFGAAGLIASRSLSRAAGFSVVVSSGTVLAVIGSGDAKALGGALFYMVGSTLACGALFLVAEVLERGRDPGSGADTAVFDDEYRDPFDDDERNEPGLVIPAAVAGLGAAVLVCTLMIAGLPPLSGFVGKLAILDGLIDLGGVNGWAIVAALSLSSLGAVIGLTRLAVSAIWTRDTSAPPLVVGAAEATGIGGLLATCILLAVLGGSGLTFADSTAGWLINPGNYAAAVLGDPGP